MDNAAVLFSSPDENFSTTDDEDLRAPAISRIAQTLYRLRRRRERLFAPGLFSDPNWDLLLDLYASEQGGGRVSITSACIAAISPTSSALRCLKQLEELGMVYRERDPMDGRRTYVRLSVGAMMKMESLLAELIGE